MEKTKICSMCGKTKPITDFYESDTYKCGYRARCKTCIIKKQKETRENDIEKFRMRNHIDYIRHKEKRQEHNREYYRLHGKEIYNKDKELFRERTKLWRKNNPILNWASQAKTRHKRKGFDVKITTHELAKIANEVIFCPFCGVKLNWSAGSKRKGAYSDYPSLDRIDNEMEIRYDNVQILCRRCNSIKNDLTMKEFIEYCKNIVRKFGNSIEYEKEE